MSIGPLFKFGIIADVQYANAPDAMNFQETKVRRYKQSLQIFDDAVNDWDTTNGILFSLVLGDIIDGKSAMIKSSKDDFDDLMQITESTNIPMHFCFGNHCHYNFSRKHIHEQLCPSDADCSPSKLYYDWSPFAKWRFISLDSYDVSLIGASSESNKKVAQSWIKQHNKNDLGINGGWFDGLPLSKKRWVPYNGGISDEQLEWLQDTLSRSRENEENVVIYCHQPIYSPNKPQSLIWNAEEVLSVIQKSSNVRLWIAGHDHDGQYSIDDSGVHHLVPCAPIECEEGQTAYGHIEVHQDKFVLDWTGRKPTNSLLPWPTEMAYPQTKKVIASVDV